MPIASIDFETANNDGASMCAAGIAIFNAGSLLTSEGWLVRPPREHSDFNPIISRKTGLTSVRVSKSPEFTAIAPTFLKLLKSADIVIAHHAGKDVKVLLETCNHFGIACPGFEYLCTYQLAKKVYCQEGVKLNLPDLAKHLGVTHKPHNAESDAKATGLILADMMKRCGATTARDLAEKVGVFVKRSDTSDLKDSTGEAGKGVNQGQTIEIQQPSAPTRRRWTDEEDQRVCELFKKGMSLEEIGADLRRTSLAIHYRLARHNLMPPPAERTPQPLE